VDSAPQVIVACEITNQLIDKGQAMPMIEQVRNNTRVMPWEMSSDASYFSTKTIEGGSPLWGLNHLFPLIRPSTQFSYRLDLEVVFPLTLP
jgi:hypothetical protein